jgi:hypothetical protein
VRALRRIPLLLLLVLGPGIGAAAPAKPPAPPASPKVEEVCAPKDADAPQLLAGAAAGSVVACWKQDGAPDACIELSRAAAPRRLTEAPIAWPVTELAVGVRDLGAGPAACAGATCKRLGPTIRAAIAKAKALGEGHYTTPHVTDDLRLLAIENQLFSIADDRRVRLRPPADLPAAPEPPRLAGVELVGNLAIASWTTCAGPCLVSAVVDGKGAGRAPSFPGGAPIGLDERRVAILPMEARAAVTVLDRATGAPLGEAALHDGTSVGMLGIAADAQTVVALAPTPRQAPTAWHITWVAAPPGAAPSVAARQALPICP